MARMRKKSKAIREEDQDIVIPEISFSEKLHSAMKEYGVYTVENRAIPEMHDGLKPVQRRVLWAAHKLGFKSSGTTYKTARLSGDVIGKYHPHGSINVDDAINNMIEGTPCPLLHGQGNFGSYTNSAPAAAARYTEVKLNKVSESLLLDPYYLKVVPLVVNYDGQEMEPAYLPSKLPFVLALAQQGIAVGITVKMPSYTLKSLRDVVVAILKGEDNTKKLSKLMEFSSAYGGKVVSDDKEQHTVFTNSMSNLTLMCDYTIVEDSKMIITGLHPEWNYDNKWPKIKLMPEVASANDLSTEDIKLEITVKKSADVETTFDKLEKLCVGDITYKCNVMSRSVDMEKEIPEVASKFYSLSPYKILLHWIKWRLLLEKLALRQEMKELKSELVRERLLLLACQSLDVIFSLLKKRNIDKVAQLAKELDISIDDAKYIWSIAVGRLDKLNEDTQVQKIKELRTRADAIKVDFDNPKKPVLKDLQQIEL